MIVGAAITAAEAAAWRMNVRRECRVVGLMESVFIFLLW
jgi:hypothetical protein